MDADMKDSVHAAAALTECQPLLSSTSVDDPRSVYIRHVVVVSNPD